MPVAATTAAKLLQSCLTLCDPIDGSPPGSSTHGVFQARALEWGAIAPKLEGDPFISPLSGVAWRRHHMTFNSHKLAQQSCLPAPRPSPQLLDSAVRTQQGTRQSQGPLKPLWLDSYKHRSSWTLRCIEPPPHICTHVTAEHFLCYKTLTCPPNVKSIEFPSVPLSSSTSFWISEA